MIASIAEIRVYLNKAASITDAELALLNMLHPLVESAVKVYLQQELERTTYTEYLPIGTATERDGLLRDADDISVHGSRVIINGGTDRSSFLQLKHLPVSATGIEIREDTGANAGQESESFGDSTLLVQGEDYFLDVDDPTNGISRSGIVHRIGAWPTEPRSIKVTYLGGFTSAQFAGSLAGALKLAVITEVANRFWETRSKQTTRGIGVIQSERIGKYGYSIGSAGSTSAVVAGGLSASVQMMLQPFRNYGRLF